MPKTIRMVASRDLRLRDGREIRQGESFDVPQIEGTRLRIGRRATPAQKPTYRWPEANLAHEAHRATVEAPPMPPPIMPDEQREESPADPTFDPSLPIDQPDSEVDAPSDEPEAATVRRRRRYQRRDMVAED